MCLFIFIYIKEKVTAQGSPFKESCQRMLTERLKPVNLDVILIEFVSKINLSVIGCTDTVASP